jgi:hypothetical protein
MRAEEKARREREQGSRKSEVSSNKREGIREGTRQPAYETVY